MSIVINVNDVQLFLNITLYTLNRFVSDLEIIVLLNNLENIEHYNKLSKNKIKYFLKSEFDFSIINNDVFLYTTENFVLIDYLKRDDFFIQNNLHGTFESFPHSDMYTVSRRVWYEAYKKIFNTIDPTIYDIKCMTNSPQIIITSLVSDIKLSDIFIQEYYFSLIKKSLDLYTDTKTIWNKEFYYNDRHSNINIDYRISNVKHGIESKKSKFICVSNLDIERAFFDSITSINKNMLKTLLNELVLYDTKIPKIRLGDDRDGGYVICDIKSDLYTFGVENTFKFESDFQKLYDCRVYMFDHTVDCETNNENIIFKKVGLDYYEHDSFISLKKCNLHNSTLKMDIEGNEYRPLYFLDENVLSSIKQIVIELHWLNTDINMCFDDKIKILKKINKYFYLVHVHAVNHVPLFEIENEQFNIIYECTFVNKNLSLDSKVINNPILPTELDRKGDLCLNDIILSNYYPYKN